MAPVRIGIVGVGQIGKQHLAAYATMPDVQLVAACDIDAPELARVAALHNIPNTYASFRELLQRDDLDAVDVCLHNNLHAPVTIAVLESGKHAYCEKPIAGTYLDGKSMCEAAGRTGKMLHIQLATLYSNETKAAQALINDGQLGRLYHARSTGFRRRGRPFVDGYGTQFFVQKPVSGGGALFDMGVYHIAQTLYLLGLPSVERITGAVYQETGMHAGRRDSSGYSVEELGTGYVRCAGGLTMDLIESWAIHLGGFEGTSIVGSRGGVRLDPFSFHTTVADMEMNASFELDSVLWRWSKTIPDLDAYDSSQHHWIAALQGRVPLLPTAQIALQTMLISNGIYLSHQLGREVTPAEVDEMTTSTALKL